MPKPVGGRGRKAPYQTVIVRIPVDVKPQIDKIVEQFRSGDLDLVETDNSEANRISQLTTIIDRYKTASKLSRDWTKCNQLIQELETEINQEK